jgi:hypothetical protein
LTGEASRPLDEPEDAFLGNTEPRAARRDCPQAAISDSPNIAALAF